MMNTGKIKETLEEYASITLLIPISDGATLTLLLETLEKKKMTSL